MKLRRDDFRKLRGGLLGCMALIAAGVGTVLLSDNAAQTARRELAAAQAARNEFDDKLKRVRSEENEIREKTAIFRQLEARGVIGEEQRLEWSELLNAIGDRRQLLNLRYEFEPQRPLDAAAPAAALSYFVSPMRLQLDLLHEEDLTRLLADIRQQANALIQVRNCLVSRSSGSADSRAAGSQLQAECRIDWITLRAPGSGEARK